MMTSAVLFFTDLDDTLVSSDGNNLEELKTLLRRLQAKSFVIPVTMKTFDEVLLLSRKLNFEFPIVISEGGCVISSLNEWLLPDTAHSFIVDRYHVRILCKPMSEIDEIIELSLESHQCSSKIGRMSRLTAEELKSILTISYEEALAATKRLCSEAFLSADANCLKGLSQRLRELGLKTSMTKRVLHVSTGSKGLGVSKVLEKLRSYSHLTIAAGDSEIDCEFLSLSDIPIILGSDVTCVRKYPFIALPYKPLTNNPVLDKILLNLGL
ncbi:MAG: HAD-IIB family hydrolase [Thermosphaera sp.]